MAAWLACHGSPFPSAAAAAAKPSRRSARSCRLCASHAGRNAMQLSPAPADDTSWCTDHSGPSPSGRSNSERFGTDRPSARSVASPYPAASTSPAGTSGAAITDTTSRPSLAWPTWTATSPACAVLATRAGCPRGEASTCSSCRPHWVAEPSALPGASSNGRSQDTFVASAVASSRYISLVISIGNFSINPSVSSLAHRSAWSWLGIGPRSTLAGSPASHCSSPIPARFHTAAAAATSGCGASIRPAASAAASSGSQPSTSTSSLRSAPLAAGAHNASSSHAPSGDATWCPDPTTAWNRRA
jgi:hypothetical protein